MRTQWCLVRWFPDHVVRLRAQAESLCCVLGQDTQHSQRLSPPRRVWELSCEIWRNDAMDWYRIKGWDARLLVASGRFKGRKGPVTFEQTLSKILWILSFFRFGSLLRIFSVFQSLYLPWNKDLWERQCTMPLNWEWTMEITPSFLLYWILSWFKDMQQNQVFCLMACMRQRWRILSPSKRKRSFTTRTNRCYSWFLTLWRLRSMRILQLKWNIGYLSRHSVVMFTRDMNCLEELSSIQILTDRYKYSGNADFIITIIKRRGELVSHNVNKWAVEQFQLFKVQC